MVSSINLLSHNIFLLQIRQDSQSVFPNSVQQYALPASFAVVTTSALLRNNSVTITLTVLMDQMSLPVVKC